MGLVGLEKLAWLEAADSSGSRRVESYGSSPGSNGTLGRINENILNNYSKCIHNNVSKIYCTGLSQHTASKFTIVSKFYHIVRKKCDNFRVRYK